MNKELISLEYDKILQSLSDHAVSEYAKKTCLDLRPFDDFGEAETALKQTAQAESLLLAYGAPSFSDLHDVRGACRRAESGAVLSIKELLWISDVLRITEGVEKFLASRVTESDSMYAQFMRIRSNHYFSDKINTAFPSAEEVSDNASSELRDIRRKQMQAKGKIKSVLDSMLRSHSKYLQENIVTVRNGRYVLPVKAEYRADVHGLVHDTSASGATLFVEPMSVVEANNAVTELEAKEHREIERILSAFSVEAGGFASQICEDFEACAFFDFCFAKAKYSTALRGSKPILNQRGYVNLRRARHPLIKKDVCVPVDIELGGEYAALIITGPNTGGKTVSIKTCGLLCLMAKSGLFIPVKEDSQVSFFDRVYADIGDEQSIEQSLSTFSAHMSNIVGILSQITDKSLVLLDELGSGTDPVEGAALAVAIIEKILANGSRLVCTTHYAELKLYALQTAGVENASCEFDVATLKPTYRLITGIPGRSNAFAIAQKLGLSDDIIDNARKHLDNENVKVENVLADLEINRIAVEKNAELADKMRLEAARELQKAEELRESLNKNSEKELRKAKQQALDIVSRARTMTDRMFSELSKIRKDFEKNDFREKLASLKAETEAQLDSLETEYDDEPKTVVKPIDRPLVKGDTVRISGINKTAVVIEVKGKNAVLQLGSARVKKAVDDLELAEDPKQKNEPSNDGSVSIDVDRMNRTAKTELDLRGMTALEADALIDEFIDNCEILGLKSCSIIHGKGTGALRSSVQAKLSKNKQVKSFRLGVYGEGETGVTIIELV